MLRGISSVLLLIASCSLLSGATVISDTSKQYPATQGEMTSHAFPVIHSSSFSLSESTVRIQKRDDNGRAHDAYNTFLDILGKEFHEFGYEYGLAKGFSDRRLRTWRQVSVPTDPLETYVQGLDDYKQVLSQDSTNLLNNLNYLLVRSTTSSWYNDKAADWSSVKHNSIFNQFKEGVSKGSGDTKTIEHLDVDRAKKFIEPTIRNFTLTLLKV